MSIEDKFQNIFKNRDTKLKFKGCPVQREVEVNCSFEYEGYAIKITVESNGDFIFGRREVELALFDSDNASHLKLNCEVRRFEPLKLTCHIGEIKYTNIAEKITSFLYELAGAKGSPFILNNMNWSREIEVEAERLNIQFSFIGCKVKATLSNGVHKESEAFKLISKLVDDEIFIISCAYSFCRSSLTEWIMKTVLCNEKIVDAHYIDSPAPHRFPNKVNPFRNNGILWNSFLEAVLEKKLSKEEFVERGIFQAISNLCWAKQLNEWTLIQHVAALEGLCKNEIETIFTDSQYRSLRNSILSFLGSFNNDFEKEKITLFKKNIENNKRILNGYNVKWHIRNKFAELNISGFYSRHYKEINDAINMRNKIVHEGWSMKWEKDILQHIQILRNSIYLILAAFFKYQENLYFFGEDLPTQLIEHA
ncbi:hypothetical protein ACL7TT_17100 [Microbulbifer sp. 2304DJ12-6]|uniref:hypothetical protein n=1 Tax=Microbulbifer sp. 2304DJ12-6 TaxID=3233340 RepID=UPI0039B0E44E